MRSKLRSIWCAIGQSLSAACSESSRKLQFSVYAAKGGIGINTMDSKLSLDDFIAEYGGHCFKSENPSLWVFGYGSLLWKPGFQYNAYQTGCIHNFVRRFNQGNETFRGSCAKPGRVANLDAKEGAQTWGLAYQFSGHEEVTKALHRLYHREVAGGDYVVIKTKFYPRSPQSPHKNIPLPHPPCCFPIPKAPTTPDAALSSSSSCYVDTQSSLVPSFWNLNFDKNFRPNHSRTFKRDLANRHQKSSKYGACGFDYHEERSDHKAPSHVLSGSNESPRRRFSKELRKKRNKDSTWKREQKETPESESTYCDLQDQTTHRETGLHSSSKSTTPLKEIDIDVDVTKTGKHYTPRSQNFGENLDFASAVDVLVFTVREDNRLYLGSDDLDIMADQIVDAEGSAGTNVEYVLRTSEFVQKYIPEENDSLLQELDSAIRERLSQREIRLEMAEKEFATSRITG